MGKSESGPYDEMSSLSRFLSLSPSLPLTPPPSSSFILSHRNTIVQQQDTSVLGLEVGERGGMVLRQQAAEAGQRHIHASHSHEAGGRAR